MRASGFFFTNPFNKILKISLRARNLRQAVQKRKKTEAERKVDE